jgi:NNP family nitrate/nitrite transporter-like MFS transporter
LACCFFPAGLAATSLIGPPHVTNVAVSLTVAVAYLLGGGAIPAGIGALGEQGLFPLGIILVGVLLMLSALLVHYLKFQGDYIEGE